METKSLTKGKLLKFQSEVYYLYKEGKMITRYTYPKEYFYISNKLGEAKIYFPDKNEVYVKTDKLFTTENNVLYIFLNNKTQDMGLMDLKFKVKETRFDEGLSVTTWIPPVELLSRISKVELVHENYQPIYSAYYKDEKIVQKIYYYDYMILNQFSLPQNITQIDYFANGDSTINKITISDLKSGLKANSQYFDFIIPEDAKIINNE
ncbi:MAG: hypothetical protein ABIJ97_04920 [Bacteroidota bacterium]